MNIDHINGNTQNYIKLTTEQIKKIKSIYSPIKINIECNDIFQKIEEYAKKIANYYNIEYRQKTIENILFQYYKLNKCYKQIDKPEKYDLMVKFKFEKKIDWSNKDYIKYFFVEKSPRSMFRWQMGDTFFIANPNIMKYVCILII